MSYGWLGCRSCMILLRPATLLASLRHYRRSRTRPMGENGRRERVLLLVDVQDLSVRIGGSTMLECTETHKGNISFLGGNRHPIARTGCQTWRQWEQRYDSQWRQQIWCKPSTQRNTLNHDYERNLPPTGVGNQAGSTALLVIAFWLARTFMPNEA